MKITNPDYIVTIKQAQDTQNPNKGAASIVAPLAETFSWDTSNSYEAPFAQGMLDKGGWATAAAAMGIRLTTQAMTAQLWQGASESTLTIDLEFQTESDSIADVLNPVIALKKLAAPAVSSSGLLQSPGPQLNLEDLGQLAKSAATTVATEGLRVAKIAGDFIGATNVVAKVMNGQNAVLNADQQSANPVNNGNNGMGGAAYWKKAVRNQVSIKIGTYAFFDSVVILNVQETWSNQMDARTGTPLHAKVSVQFKPMFLVTQDDIDQILKARRAA